MKFRILTNGTFYDYKEMISYKSISEAKRGIELFKEECKKNEWRIIKGV